MAELVTRTGVRGLQVGLLTPGSTTAGEDIHCSAPSCVVVALAAVHARRTAGFTPCTNGQCITRQRYRIAEHVIPSGVGGLQVGLLTPGGTTASKNIHRSALPCAVIVLAAVHARRAAGFMICANRQRISRQRYRMAEPVARSGVRGLQVGLLTPGGTTAGKDIHRSAVSCAVIALTAVHARRTAVFKNCTNGQRISRQRYRMAEQVVRSGVRGLQVGLLTPGSSTASEDIHRSAIPCAVIALAAVHARRTAAFLACTNRQRISRQRYRMAEQVARSGVRGLQVGLRELIAVNIQRIEACIGCLGRGRIRGYRSRIRSCRGWTGGQDQNREKG